MWQKGLWSLLARNRVRRLSLGARSGRPSSDPAIGLIEVGAEGVPGWDGVLEEALLLRLFSAGSA
jgi:hypothetical protein